MANYYEIPEHKVIEQVLEHMKQLGIEPIYDTHLIADDRLHRYSIEGDRGRERSGAYVIHLDGRPAWFIQSWRHNVKANGKYQGQLPELSPEEKREYAKLQAQKEAERKRQQLAREARATRWANIFYRRTTPASSAHPYLQSKNVTSEPGIREDKNNLIIPLRDINGKIITLQSISPDGEKRYFACAPTSGTFFQIGDITPETPIFICEGIATGISIHGITICITINKNGYGSGFPVICATNCYNLKAVAQAIRKKYPQNKIFVCSDNDTKNEIRNKDGKINETNPGLFYASILIRDKLADGLLLPSFDNSEQGSDWNDYCSVYGLSEATKEFSKQMALAEINRTPQFVNNSTEQNSQSVNTASTTSTDTKKNDTAHSEKNTQTQKENQQEHKKSLADLKAKFELTSAFDILDKEFTPIRWAVPNLIPEGLTIFAGNPKVGKSWCALDLAITIGIGGYAFGNIEVEKGRTLYLAYEDTQARLKSRMEAMGLSKEDLEGAGIDICTKFPKQDEGGMEYLELYIQENKDTRLIIIDTLEKFRKPTPNRNIYKEEYATLSEIKALADKYHVAIVCIHHFNKGNATDWINKVSGTNAIAGAADTIIALQRDRVADGLSEGMSAVLHITSRMCEERDLALKFENFRWNITGKYEKKRSDEEQTIINFLKEKGEAGATPKEIADEIGGNYHSLKTRLRKLTVEGFIVKLSYGKYVLDEFKNENNSKEKGDEQITIDGVEIS